MKINMKFLFLVVQLAHGSLQVTKNRVTIENRKTFVRPEFISIGEGPGMIAHNLSWVFQNQTFVNYMNELQPAYLRFGGTRADLMFFNATLPGEAKENIICKNALHGKLPSKRKWKMLWRDAPFDPVIMQPKDLDRLYQGIRCANLKLILGLNLNNRYTDGLWNNTNVVDMLKYIKDRKYKIDYELGNEPNSYKHKFNASMDPATQIQDTTRLAALLQRIGLKSKIFGPDTTGRGPTALTYITQYIALNPIVSALTYHHYTLNGHEATRKDYLSPATFTAFSEAVKLWTTSVGNLTATELWLGESAVSFGGGENGFTNRFIGCFLWADKLGQAALYGIKVVVRESMFSGFYGLIGPDLLPNPDYWVCVYHKKLMGKVVLQLGTHHNDKYIKIYGHCGIVPNTITLMMINYGHRFKKTYSL